MHTLHEHGRNLCEQLVNEQDFKYHRVGKYVIIISKDLGRWHLSISHPDHYPTWDVIKEARYKYLPKDIYVAMILPPPDQYVNLCNNCFQLWEVNDPMADTIWKG